ncbi:MAG: histidinol-phosphatase HisJ family protein [Candidatus Fermentibacteraceae bacterium]|nr:histidinol-phosphatase HisJ family protein [Candidatus Fermentibacteraceae bacterium]MBN2609209.1 histidinol-phosphatase HisJ family protein [Candidatus Fermentibacteraceae bacterium]
MPLPDMHVHTSDSPDAEIPARILVRRGREEGLSAIGFVAHLDMNPEDSCYDSFDPLGYEESVEGARRESENRITVMKGLEVGEPHRFQARAKALADYSDYDFIVGALHHVEGAGLILGDEVFRNSEHLPIVEEYYRETLRMVETADMDVLAHMGLVRRGLAMAGLDHAFDEISLWPDLLRGILSALIQREVALELNTSGLRRKEKTTYPTPRVIELYREMGGERITLGSDSHRDPHVFFGLAEGRMILLEKGFEKTFIYRAREPRPLPLFG